MDDSYWRESRETTNELVGYELNRAERRKQQRENTKLARKQQGKEIAILKAKVKALELKLQGKS